MPPKRFVLTFYWITNKEFSICTVCFIIILPNYSTGTQIEILLDYVMQLFIVIFLCRSITVYVYSHWFRNADSVCHLMKV